MCFVAYKGLFYGVLSHFALFQFGAVYIRTVR
nr:MAG TPA: hypothetical protein [Caudoviricetes sp.]